MRDADARDLWYDPAPGSQAAAERADIWNQRLADEKVSAD